MHHLFPEEVPNVKGVAEQQLRNLKAEEKKKREALRAKKLPKDEEDRQMEELNRRTVTNEEFNNAVCHHGDIGMFLALEDKSFDNVMLLWQG